MSSFHRYLCIFVVLYCAPQCLLAFRLFLSAFHHHRSLIFIDLFEVMWECSNRLNDANNRILTTHEPFTKYLRPRIIHNCISQEIFGRSSAKDIAHTGQHPIDYVIDNRIVSSNLSAFILFAVLQLCTAFVVSLFPLFLSFLLLRSFLFIFSFCSRLLYWAFSDCLFLAVLYLSSSLQLRCQTTTIWDLRFHLRNRFQLEGYHVFGSTVYLLIFQSFLVLWQRVRTQILPSMPPASVPVSSTHLLTLLSALILGHVF
jgi:hypothetical protein